MGRLSERIAAFSCVGLDTSILIYHLEAHPNYAPLTEELLNGIEQNRWRAVTSVITLMELTVKPWQLGRQDIARQYETLLFHFPNLSIVPIDREIARHAAQLRAKFALRPPDALQVAACRLHHAEAFITNDRRLEHLDPLIPIVVLDNFYTFRA